VVRVDGGVLVVWMDLFWWILYVTLNTVVGNGKIDMTEADLPLMVI
jgi:hypothetical protein